MKGILRVGHERCGDAGLVKALVREAVLGDEHVCVNGSGTGCILWLEPSEVEIRGE